MFSWLYLYFSFSSNWKGFLEYFWGVFAILFLLLYFGFLVDLSTETLVSIFFLILPNFLIWSLSNFGCDIFCFNSNKLRYIFFRSFILLFIIFLIFLIFLEPLGFVLSIECALFILLLSFEFFLKFSLCVILLLIILILLIIFIWCFLFSNFLILFILLLSLKLFGLTRRYFIGDI